VPAVEIDHKRKESMHLRSRLAPGLLIVLATTAAFAADEAAQPQTMQPTPSPAPVLTQEGNQSAPVGNGLLPVDADAALGLRAADVTPTSWSNVKALWG
jgi:hypothetical protein